MAKMINCKINGVALQVEDGTSILAAAEKVQMKIPTLCYHPDLPAWASCGICVVKIEGSPKFFRACTTPIAEGNNIITHDPDIVAVRKNVLQLILSNHPNECLYCPRNGTCELQTIAAEFGIREQPFQSGVRRLPKDETSPAIVLDPYKCIQCGRCAKVCQEMQNVWALEMLSRGDETRIAPAADVTLAESPCVKCGQCSAHCPVGAIYERDDTKKVWDAIQAHDKHVVVQIAPAVRVALGECFDMKPGEIVTGKIYAALRKLGFNAVFDTNFAADLTIMEEGTEFVNRFTKGGVLPLITSCCPAWVDYMEKYYTDFIPNFSTAKSPMMMQGAITKTYYAEQVKKAPKDIYSVAIMPCTAKKYEIGRDEHMKASGVNDVDCVLTTRELAKMIKEAGIDFNELADEKVDSPIGQYAGAGTIFASTGGVMEAALRTAYTLITKEDLKGDAVNFKAVRGLKGVKEAEIDIKGTKVKIAVAHTLSNVEQVMEAIREDRAAKRKPRWDFIEVMACPGGCISGGGQPYGTTDEVRMKRMEAVYKDDDRSAVRCSHQNPDIQKIYKDYLKEPGSHKAHELLHTHYVERPLYQK
jgi:NADH-quinone oxidoreductase subunit G